MSGQIVKRKINSFENENFTTIKFGYYTYKTNDKVDWKISNETKSSELHTTESNNRIWWQKLDSVVLQGHSV